MGLRPTQEEKELEKKLVSLFRTLAGVDRGIVEKATLTTRAEEVTALANRVRTSQGESAVSKARSRADKSNTIEVARSADRDLGNLWDSFVPDVLKPTD